MEINESDSVPAFILTDSELPEYEMDLDHRGLLDAWEDRHGESRCELLF